MKSKNIFHWDELPAWLKVDPHIRYGYRHELKSFAACFWSLFYVHNEWMNIWSHLLPGLCLLIILVRVDYLVLQDGTDEVADRFVIQLYVAGTAICLLFSAVYHCVRCHSEEVSRRYLKLDYLGIVVSITVGSISSTYVGLRGDLRLQTIYMALTANLATGVFYNLLGPKADGPKAASWRVVILATFFCSSFAPPIHKLLTDGVSGLENFPVRHLAITTTFYLIGTIFYATRFPEKYIPKTFDVWGASHQIFHIMIAVGQINFLLGLGTAMQNQRPISVRGKYT